MKVSEIYTSGNKTLLNSAKCRDNGYFGRMLTITDVEAREIRGKTKLVVCFEQIPEALALNRTNALILANAFGDDTNAWIGKQITLVPTKRMFQGQLLDAIEVVPQNVQQKPKVPRKA